MSAPRPPHTPAPLGWEYSLTTTANGGFHAYLTDASGRKIAALWGGQEEKVANAHLFSAAPEGLAFAMALEASWLESFPGGPDSDSGLAYIGEEHRELWRQCRAFIAKATGAA